MYDFYWTIIGSNTILRNFLSVFYEPVLKKNLSRIPMPSAAQKLPIAKVAKEGTDEQNKT